MVLVGTASSPKMRVDGLKIYPLCYVGTPYTFYSDGLEAAWLEACRISGELVKRGVKVFCPITHGHAIAVYGGIDQLDTNIWYEQNAIFMKKCDCLIVAMMKTWEISKGLEQEIQYFLEASKPVYYLDPATLEV